MTLSEVFQAYLKAGAVSDLERYTSTHPSHLTHDGSSALKILIPGNPYTEVTTRRQLLIGLEATVRPALPGLPGRTVPRSLSGPVQCLWLER